MAGVEEFSGFEVIRAAMEVEKQGHHFYSAVALRARNDIVREVFTWLAQDEVGHLQTLEGLMARYEEGAFWEDEENYLPYLRRFSAHEIFPSAQRLEAVLEGDHPDLRSLELAIEAEEKFAEYFQRAAQHARTPDGREAFAWLAAEEERHAAILRERHGRPAGK
jgi:rubrerythrin